MGHPYLMQLLGYYLLCRINDKVSTKSYEVASNDIEEIIPVVTDAFERRTLRPMVEELSATERDYLRSMALCLGANRIALTADVAQTLNRQQRQLSRARETLIGSGIILAPKHGEVMFNVPYLAAYMLKPQPADEEVELAKSWGL